VAAVGAIVISVGWLIYWSRPDRPPGNVNQMEQLGHALATETVRAVNNTGRIVVWRLRIANNADVSVDRATDAFLKALRKTPGVTIAATEEDEFNLGDPDRWSKTAMERSKFIDLVTKHRDKDALVLIGGTPNLRGDDYDHLPTPRPKVLAAAFILAPPREIIERQAAQLVITFRQQTDPTLPVPKTAAEQFNRSFMIVTKETANQLP
jgi:hypothetical protein